MADKSRPSISEAERLVLKMLWNAETFTNEVEHVDLPALSYFPVEEVHVGEAQSPAISREPVVTVDTSVLPPTEPKAPRPIPWDVLILALPTDCREQCAPSLGGDSGAST